MNINQKVVIVTGSGGGIGEGIAKHFAAHGAKVLVNDIQATAGQKVVQEIQATGGTAAFLLQTSHALTMSKRWCRKL